MASGGKKKVRLTCFGFTVLQHRPCVVHVVRDKHVLHKFAITSFQLRLLHTFNNVSVMNKVNSVIPYRSIPFLIVSTIFWTLLNVNQQ